MLDFKVSLKCFLESNISRKMSYWDAGEPDTCPQILQVTVSITPTLKAMNKDKLQLKRLSTPTAFLLITTERKYWGREAEERTAISLSLTQLCTNTRHNTLHRTTTNITAEQLSPVKTRELNQQFNCSRNSWLFFLTIIPDKQ